MSTKTSKKLQAFHWVGMDVSKPYFDAAVLSRADQEMGAALRDFPATRFARTKAGVKEFVTWLEGLLGEGIEALETRVVMEATGKYSSELAVWLLESRRPLGAAIVNPQPASHFIKSLALRNNTDRLAARALALYGAQRRPAPYEPLSKEEADLRELTRYRCFLVNESTAMKNHAGEKAHTQAVLRMQAKRRNQIRQDIAAIEKQMRAQVAKAEGLNKDIALFETIYGIGFITAVTVRVELGDLRRFERARQLSAFAGLSPREFQSGTSVRKRTRMSKAGNKRVRSALYMAACAAIARPNPWQVYYHQLIAKGKKPMEALGALMRKLLVLMRAILISGQPYDPRNKTCGKLNHELLGNSL
jgi:transposase